MTKQQQTGFTLLEFMIVIIILCVLAAVAVPKLSLWWDAARAAKLKEVKLSMELANNLIHAKALATACCQASTMNSVMLGGQEVYTQNGYAMDAQELAKVMELDSEFAFDMTGIGYMDPNNPSSPLINCRVKYISASPYPSTVAPDYQLWVDNCSK